jgi:hypothetical protein
MSLLRVAGRFAAPLLAAALGACALLPDTPPERTGTRYQISVPFDQEQATRLLADGSATIAGRSAIRRPDGGLATCAGQPVYLVPATEYARVRMRALYGSDQRGARLDGRSHRFEPDPPAYSRLVRQERCDANGNFRFDRVAAGSFFVTAVVRWQQGERQAGGSLMQRATAVPGRRVELNLSR